MLNPWQEWHGSQKRMKMGAGEAVAFGIQALPVTNLTVFVAFSLFFKTRNHDICCFLKMGDLVHEVCFLKTERIKRQCFTAQRHPDISWIRGCQIFEVKNAK